MNADNQDRAFRLAVLASHPIQYQAPLFRELAAVPEIDLTVLFCCGWGSEPYFDSEFQTTFSWDIPLLEGYHHEFLPNWGRGSGPTSFWSLINPRVFTVLRRGHFDALWIHGWSLVTNWLAWGGAIAQNIPVLLRYESTGFGGVSGLKGTAKQLVRRAVFHRIAGFLAIGTNNRNFYRSDGVNEERIFWTPYAVDNDFFFDAARGLAGQKRSLRIKAGINPDLPVVLFCGKLVEKKRPFDLLEAFRLLGQSPGASLVLTGDGPLRPSLERFVSENRLANVHFLGFKNQSEISVCYALADLLVLPSSLETWGLVVNEAMCFGLPVIASDQVGAAADLVNEGKNGFVYPVGDVHALSRRLGEVLQGEGVLGAMGEKSLAHIRNWGLAQDVDGILTALRAVTGGRQHKHG